MCLSIKSSCIIEKALMWKFVRWKAARLCMKKPLIIITERNVWFCWQLMLFNAFPVFCANLEFDVSLLELRDWSSWMRGSSCSSFSNTTASAGPPRTNWTWVIYLLKNFFLKMLRRRPRLLWRLACPLHLLCFPPVLQLHVSTWNGCRAHYWKRVTLCFLRSGAVGVLSGKLVHRRDVFDTRVDAKVNSGRIRKGRHFERGSVTSQASPRLGAVLLWKTRSIGRTWRHQRPR